MTSRLDIRDQLSWKMNTYNFDYNSDNLLTLFMPNFLNRKNNPPSFFGTVNYHCKGYQDRNFKLISQQYRARPAVQSDQALYWWQTLITFGVGRIRVNIGINWEIKRDLPEMEGDVWWQFCWLQTPLWITQRSCGCYQHPCSKLRLLLYEVTSYLNDTSFCMAIFSYSDVQPYFDINFPQSKGLPGETWHYCLSHPYGISCERSPLYQLSLVVTYISFVCLLFFPTY